MISSTNHGSVSRANAVDPAIRRFPRVRWTEIFNYLLTYQDANRIVRGLDAAALANLDRRFGEADPAPGYSKYLDVRYWIHAKLRRVRALGLHRPPPRRVLDLGTGTGYFPFLVKKLGNEAVGVDMGDVEFYDEMIALLGVERHLWTIRPFQSLPEWGRFDLVTAFQICFNRTPDGTAWGVQEWDFFRRDVADHLLAPGGRMVLEFNGPPSPEVARYFADAGAKVDRTIISL
jgi:SAM-dependent methyltransferase